MALHIGDVNRDKSKYKTAPKGQKKATCPADRIAEDSRNILKTSKQVLGKAAKKSKESPHRSVLMARLDTAHAARRQGAKARRDEKLKELHELQGIGFIAPNEVAAEMETERRREEVYKLHLRGFNKSLMANFFGVSVPTITNDLKMLRNNLIQELTSLGAEGLVTKSYSMYEMLQHECIKILDHQSIDDVKQAVQLIRLAKDIEDSKNKLLSTIGAVKPPKNTNAESIVQGDSSGAPLVEVDVMKDILAKIGDRMSKASGEAATIDGEASEVSK